MEEAVANAGLLAEAMNQLAFISAIVGGFSVALVAGILAAERTTLTRSTAAVLSSVALLQIGCTLFFSMTSFRILTMTANGRIEPLNTLLSSIDPSIGPFVVAFFASVLLFFVGIALTGWIFGRWTGWISTVVAAVSLVLAFYGLSLIN